MGFSKITVTAVSKRPISQPRQSSSFNLKVPSQILLAHLEVPLENANIFYNFFFIYILC